MDFPEFQQQIAAIYGPRDAQRGIDGTFRRLVEEVGELARALRQRERGALEAEVSDVLAWTVSLAVLVGVEADHAVRRYAAGCPKCGATPCACPAELRTVSSSGSDA